MQLDNEFVRGNFPAFSQADLQGWAFFENAGGSYACGQVIKALNDYYMRNKVQPYYEYAASTEAGQLMDAAKQRMAQMLNVGTSEVNFGPSTSQNTFNLAQAFAEHLDSGDEIIVTNQDHEANIGSWQRLEKRGLVVRQWQVSATSGELAVADLAQLLNANTKAVAFTHCSNIVASINPVKAITDLVRAAGAISIVDGVSYCGHGLPDVKALGADVYLFSLYKVYGPHLGVMVLRDELNQALPSQGHFFNQDKPGYRFTPAGPDHAQIAAVNGVMDYIEVIYKHHFGETTGNDTSANARANQVKDLFQAHERQIVQPLLDYISGHPQLRLIGQSQATGRAPTVAFTSQKHSTQAITQALAQQKLMTGWGDFYAYRLMQALGIDPATGVCRLSLVHYNNAQEVDRLISAIDAIH